MHDVRKAIQSVIVYDDGSALVRFYDGEVASARAHQVTTPAQPDEKSNADVAREALRSIAENNGDPQHRIAAAQILLTCGGGE